MCIRLHQTAHGQILREVPIETPHLTWYNARDHAPGMKSSLRCLCLLAFENEDVHRHLLHGKVLLMNCLSMAADIEVLLGMHSDLQSACDQNQRLSSGCQVL